LKDYVVGLDIGGTKLAAGLFDLNLKEISFIKCDTEAFRGGQVVVENCKAIVHQVLEKSGISRDRVASIGISSPGPLDTHTGIVTYVETIGWKNVPIRSIMEEEFNVSVVLENDANAAALAENVRGAGEGTKNMIYITVSTGVGSGIILEKKLYRGSHDAAGEFGHICIVPGGRPCGCGNRGCLQSYASGTALANAARAGITAGENSAILLKAGGIPEKIHAFQVEEAAKENDAFAIKLWEEMGYHLGLGISILVQLFDPDRIVIGGGMSRAWDLFYGSMMESVRSNTYEVLSENLQVVPALLGDKAGVFGAATLGIAIV